MNEKILIVEDEEVLRQTLAELLRDEGYQPFEAPNGKVAYQMVLDQPFDLVLTDIRMPEMDGKELLEHLRKTAPDTPVIILTAYGKVQDAVEAMQTGARDYLLKPVDFADVLIRIQRALEFGQLAHHQQIIADQLAAESTFHNLVGESQAMQRLFETVHKLADVLSTVLIVGESGTGKELFARAIHYNGITRNKPFVAVNCGAIPETLIESELFGHRRGAFTGATQDKTGYFEAADGGTLFLDEISTLPLGVQSSLLRALEEKTVTPVGDTQPRSVELRVIAATNCDLHEMVRKNLFREDLLYRLDVVKLELPPLRERREDIPLLVNHFLDKFCRKMNKKVMGLSNAAMRAMIQYKWPGNVRELANVIERAVIFADGRRIELSDLPFATAETIEVGEDLKQAVRQFERQYIMYALQQYNYDKTETAKHLGIGVSSLYRKLDELDIPKNLHRNNPSAAPSRSGADA